MLDLNAYNIIKKKKFSGSASLMMPIKKSEDCLYLNIFTSKYCLKYGNCAVVFYIHGGDFNAGSVHRAKPDILVNLC